MNILTTPFDYSTLEGADRVAVRMYNKPSRWFTTVLVQVALGLWFVVAPAHTLEVIWVPYSPQTALLFQLYGAILINRGLLEQYVRSRLDLPLIYAMMITSIPFEVISTVALIYACLGELMNPWIGWVWMILFAASAVQHAVIVVWHLREKKKRASGT